MKEGGVLHGPSMQPADIAALAYQTGPKWRDAHELVTAVAVALAECNGRVGSYNDNVRRIDECRAGQKVALRAQGAFVISVVVNPKKGELDTGLLPSGTKVIVSRDCGLYEISIPVDQIGSAIETRLREDVHYNAERAYALYTTKTSSGTIRRWQPWAAYNSGVWLNDSYRGRAVFGVTNFLNTRLAALAKQHPEWEHEHTLPSPLISVPTARRLFPGVPFG